MRKKDKYILGGATIVFGITAIIDVIMQYAEHKKKGLELNRERIVRVIEGDLDNLDSNPRFLREMFES